MTRAHISGLIIRICTLATLTMAAMVAWRIWG